jgi:hypothetical protein
MLLALENGHYFATPHKKMVMGEIKFDAQANDWAKFKLIVATLCTVAFYAQSGLQSGTNVFLDSLAVWPLNSRLVAKWSFGR